VPVAVFADRHQMTVQTFQPDLSVRADQDSSTIWLDLTVAEHSDRLVISGRLTASTAVRVDAVLQRLETGCRRLDVDLDGVLIADSDGVAPILAAGRRRSAARLPPLRITATSPAVRRVLRQLTALQPGVGGGEEPQGLIQVGPRAVSAGDASPCSRGQQGPTSSCHLKGVAGDPADRMGI
jgi:anti-anti-sigma regulatory factor